MIRRCCTWLYHASPYDKPYWELETDYTITKLSFAKYLDGAMDGECDWSVHFRVLFNGNLNMIPYITETKDNIIYQP